jgi:hypothetical protein
VVTAFTGQASISLVSFPAGGALSGTLKATFVNGVATFSGLKVTKAGSYVLRVTAPGGLTLSITITTLGRQT